MKQLMISLDKNILNKDSLVARRMIYYGQDNDLFILIPNYKKDKFDLSPTVHVWSSGGWIKKGQFIRMKWIAGQILKKEKIEIITSQDPFYAGLLGLLLKHRFKIPLEVQIHGDFYSEYYKNLGLFWKIKLFFGKHILHRADKIRVVGERIKKSVLDLGIEESKIIVRPIQNNPDIIKNWVSDVNLRAKFSNYEKIFLVLGRIEPVKNISWLIEIFKDINKNKNYLLLIVGRGGGEEKIITQKISNFGLDKNIKIQNWTEDPYGYIKSADCILFPSLSEGYGLVPVEASIIGTPVIMNNVGVANFELKPGLKVKILPINDKEKWIEAILNI